MMPSTVGIIANRRKSGIDGILLRLLGWLASRGVKALVWDDLAGLVPEASLAPIEDLVAQSDVVIALGGDGTLLRAARAVEGRLTPILGVNVGSLGFLTEVAVPEMEEAIAGVLAGRFGFEDRMNLETTVVRGGEVAGVFTALNDAVINKGALARVIEVKMTVGGEYVAVYTADGLIVSTPTGSTGYSLSAGGPIVNPKMDALIATPICPHTLAVRPMIISAEEALEVELWAGVGLNGEPEVKLTIDGQVGFDLASGDVLRFRRSERRTRLILSGRRSFYEVLRQKLKWGDTRRKSQ
jgi:NAD+ kinase